MEGKFQQNVAGILFPMRLHIQSACVRLRRQQQTQDGYVLQVCPHCVHIFTAYQQ